MGPSPVQGSSELLLSEVNGIITHALITHKERPLIAVIHNEY